MQGWARARGLETTVGECGVLVLKHLLARADHGLKQCLALGSHSAAGGGTQAGEAKQLDQQLNVLVELAIQLAHLGEGGKRKGGLRARDSHPTDLTGSKADLSQARRCL